MYWRGVLGNYVFSLLDGKKRMRVGGKKTLTKKYLNLFPKKVTESDKKQFVSISVKVIGGDKTKNTWINFEEVTESGKNMLDQSNLQVFFEN